MSCGSCFNDCNCNSGWDGKKFWLVFRVDGAAQHPGKFKKHATKESAEAEAKRMTSQQRNTFMVLETVSGFQPPLNVEPVVFTDEESNS